MKKFIVCITILSLLFTIAACGGQKEETGTEATETVGTAVTDGADRETVPDSPAKKAVDNAASAAEPKSDSESANPEPQANTFQAAEPTESNTSGNGSASATDETKSASGLIGSGTVLPDMPIE